MNSSDGNVVSVVTTGRIYIPSVWVLMWIYGEVPRVAVQTFYLYKGTYEMKVNASTSQRLFVKIVTTLCHRQFHQLLLGAAELRSIFVSLSPESFIKY